MHIASSKTELSTFKVDFGSRLLQMSTYQDAASKFHKSVQQDVSDMHHVAHSFSDTVRRKTQSFATNYIVPFGNTTAHAMQAASEWVGHRKIVFGRASQKSVHAIRRGFTMATDEALDDLREMTAAVQRGLISIKTRLNYRDDMQLRLKRFSNTAKPAMRASLQRGKKNAVALRNILLRKQPMPFESKGFFQDMQHEIKGKTASMMHHVCSMTGGKLCLTRDSKHNKSWEKKTSSLMPVGKVRDAGPKRKSPGQTTCRSKANMHTVMKA